MRPSIDLNWLSRRDKQLPIPQLHYDPLLEEYGGVYYDPEFGIFEYDENHTFDCKNGLIVVSTIYEEDIESTLAHEWRHHWQTFNGCCLDYEYGLESYDFSDWDTYDHNIKRYFLENDFEFDALLFEARMTKNEQAKERLSLIGRWRTL